MSDNILVTGRWGETHVTSAQAGNFNSGIVGDGCYVMSGLDATMTNANTCHISPGFGSFNGRDFEVPAGGIDLTIDNGTQAQYRNDLVVVRYALEPSSQTESAELVVVKGAPAASEPADPAINEGSILDGDSPVDMPLWRIPLDGITVGDPVRLFEVMPSLAELQDSVSRDLGGGVTLVTSGRAATLHISHDAPVTTTYAQIATIPEAVRPAMPLYGTGYVASSGVLAHVYVNTDGQVQVRGTSAGRVVNASVTWVF